MDIAPAVAALPSSPPPEPPAAYEARALSRPATAFNGDFYFTAETGDGFWFAAGDFAGHGLRAAIFTAMIQEELEALVRPRGIGPEEVVAKLDRMLRREIPGNRFASLVVGKAGSDGAVELVNAGHCHPIVVRADGDLELFAPHGPILGLAPSPRWRAETLQLLPGDRLILYTDGLVEAENGDGEPFGVDRLLALVRATPEEAPLEAFLSASSAFSGGRVADDVTVFVIARR